MPVILGNIFMAVIVEILYQFIVVEITIALLGSPASRIVFRKMMVFRNNNLAFKSFDI